MKGKIVTETKIFKVREAEITYPNGKTQKYEYMSMYDDATGSVMAFALTDQKELVLIDQYLAAMDAWGLILPGGLIKEGETVEQATTRELAEETSLLAKNVQFIGTLDVLPKYVFAKTHILLAIELEESDQYEGDEIEDLKVVKIPLGQVKDKIYKGEITDARTIAGIFWAMDYLQDKAV